MFAAQAQLKKYRCSCKASSQRNRSCSRGLISVFPFISISVLNVCFISRRSLQTGFWWGWDGFRLKGVLGVSLWGVGGWAAVVLPWWLTPYLLACVTPAWDKLHGITHMPTLHTAMGKYSRVLEGAGLMGCYMYFYFLSMKSKILFIETIFVSLQLTSSIFLLSVTITAEHNTLISVFIFIFFLFYLVLYFFKKKMSIF